MKAAVNGVYTLLCLSACEPDEYARLLQWADRMTEHWDPAELEFNF